MTMMRSNSNSAEVTRADQPPRWAIFVYLTVSLVGVVDAGYLTVSYYQKSEVTCSILNGCSQVLSSSYATMLGAPTALYGLLFYLLMLGGTVWYLYATDLVVLYKISIIALLAFLASLGFVYIQAFVLSAWCFYCLISAVLSTVLAAVAAYILLTTDLSMIAR